MHTVGVHILSSPIVLLLQVYKCVIGELANTSRQTYIHTSATHRGKAAIAQRVLQSGAEKLRKEGPSGLSATDKGLRFIP